MIDSICLHHIHVKLTGLQLPASVFFPFLKITVISADNQSIGNSLFINECSKISFKGYAKTELNSFKTLG
jgi:hypothetical protein